jgi:hypothetical protein
VTGDLKRQIESLERARPDPQNDPAGYRSISNEITRLIDADRAWNNAPSRKVV